MDGNANNPIEPRQNAPVSEAALARYADGRLAEDARASVEERLKGDPAARRTLDAMREEAKLIQAALENLSEPETKIADKVMATLHGEHQRRMALARARRFRNQLVAALSAAALVMLAFYAVRPSGGAGRMVAGAGATVIQRGEKTVPLGKDGRFYEGDRVRTGSGQFVKLELAGGSTVELYEESVLRIVRGAPAPVVALESGRAGIEVRARAFGPGLEVETPFGVIVPPDDASLDLWLPAKEPVCWPAWTDVPAAKSALPALATQGTARWLCVTIVDGSASFRAAGSAGQTHVPARTRMIFGENGTALSSMPVRALGALDARREALSARAAPARDRALLGLCELGAWTDLGRRLGLTESMPGGEAGNGAVRFALNTLDAGASAAEAAPRAERLGLGQVAFRNATQGLKLSDKRRWRARVVEGLAHYERGRALVELNTQAEARGAFEAAAVAFHEALKGVENDDQTTVQAEGLDLTVAPHIAPATKLAGLLPEEQALLLARFFQPWALYRLSELGRAPSGEDEHAPASLARDPVAAFEAAQKLFGPSIETLGARFGWALALEQAGLVKEAASALEEISAESVAGLGAETRARTLGLRQAAHVERMRLHAAAGAKERLHEAAEEARLRFPLDMDGALGKAIQAYLPDAK